MITRGEIDAGLIGISAPVFGADGEVLGSLGIVAAAGMLDTLPDASALMPARVTEQAAALTAALGA